MSLLRSFLYFFGAETPRGKLLFEKLAVAELGKKVAAFYGHRRMLDVMRYF
jgi:hypothetical protein